MARTSGFRRLTWLCVPALVVLLVPLAADAQQRTPAPAPSGPPATAPGAVAPVAPPAPGAPTAPVGPGAAPTPLPAPTPVPAGPPGLAPGGPAASPVVPLPDRATPAPAGPVGPFRFAPPLEAVGPLRVQAFGTIEGEFTDNANQTKNDKDAEFRTRLAPGIAARLDRPNTSGVFIYAPQLFVGENDTSLNHALTLRGRWRPTPFIELSGGDELARSDDFRDQADPGSRRTGTESFLENQASVEAAYVPPNARAALSYTHRLILNEDEGLDDSQTHILRPSFLFQAPRWTAGGGYALSRGEYSVSSDYWEHTIDGRYTRNLSRSLIGIAVGLFTLHEAEQQAAVDFTITRARAGVNWTLAPERTLEALAGVDLFAPDPGSTEARPSGLLAYTQRFPWFALAAGYQAGFQERFQEVDNAGVSFTQNASVVLTSTAFRSLTGTFALRWTYNDFQITTGQPGTIGRVQEGVKEHTFDLELGVRYQILRPLFASAGYVFTVRSSDDPNAEFTENRLRIGLTYTYDLL